MAKSQQGLPGIAREPLLLLRLRPARRLRRPSPASPRRPASVLVAQQLAGDEARPPQPQDGAARRRLRQPAPLNSPRPPCLPFAPATGGYGVSKPNRAFAM